MAQSHRVGPSPPFSLASVAADASRPGFRCSTMMFQKKVTEPSGALLPPRCSRWLHQGLAPGRWQPAALAPGAHPLPSHCPGVHWAAHGENASLYARFVPVTALEFIGLITVREHPMRPYARAPCPRALHSEFFLEPLSCVKRLLLIAPLPNIPCLHYLWHPTGACKLTKNAHTKTGGIQIISCVTSPAMSDVPPACLRFASVSCD